MAKFIVVGAGVVGVATAWQLCKAGHQVTLVDRNGAPCGGASLKNGAQLSYSYCDALASPSLIGRMPGILLGRDPAFRAFLQPDSRFLFWGMRFVWNARAAAFERNTRALLALAASTQRLLPGLLDEFPMEFDYAVAGKMILCHTPAQMDHGRSIAAMKRGLGIRIEVLDRAAAEAVEPALKDHPDAFLGAIYSPDDCVGRPSQFCAALVAGLTERYGLKARYLCGVRKLLTRNGRVSGVAFRNYESEDCDGVVLATGYDTGLLPPLARFGAIWPVQGYSLTAPALPGAIKVSVTDPKRRLVIARLGDTIRIAGIADIGRRAFTFDQSRYESLKSEAIGAFPLSFDPSVADGWSDARPCTPSSQPMIRRGAVPGVYLNLGHGTLGWTLCLGSAEALGRIVAADFAKHAVHG